MNQGLITTIGIVAAIVTTSAFLPQAWKTFKTKKTGDFSWAYLGLFSSGVATWLVYGLLRKDPAIIGANGITLVLMIAIMVVKIRY
jgi:MtN3 and saliva related transmembrane protein